MQEKIKKFLKENNCLIFLIIIFLILMILSYHELGFSYNIDSDDMSYIKSGINFAKNHTITLQNIPTAQIMPGMTFIIGLISSLFGEGKVFMVALKLLWLVFGGASILYFYKILNLYTNKWIAFIGSLFLLTPDYLWTNNLILTETPFMLFLLMLIYYGLKLAKDNDTYSYIMIVICYIFCLFIRPNIALYPAFLFIYLLIKKYNFKKLIFQGLIALVILLLVLTPWIYRNYKVFDKFIPLTYGIGNPLLLGTYQGVGYPSDDELDYENNVLKQAPEELQYYIKNPDVDKKMGKYYSLEYDRLKATYKMNEWWKKDKMSMLKSYFYIKPKLMIASSFYWKNILGITENMINLLRKIEVILFIICLLIVLVSRKYFTELIFLLSIYGYNFVLYCYTFAFGRYAITINPIQFIVIALGLSIVYNFIKEKLVR